MFSINRKDLRNLIKSAFTHKTALLRVYVTHRNVDISDRMRANIVRIQGIQHAVPIEPREAWVFAEVLQKGVAAMDDKDLFSVDVVDGRVVLKQDTFTVRLMSPDFPPKLPDDLWPTPSIEEEILPRANVLGRLDDKDKREKLASLLAVVSTDETRPALCHVAGLNGRTVATDGATLQVIRGELLPEDYLLPAQAAKAICTLKGAAVFAPKQVRVETLYWDLTMNFELPFEAYPDISKVFPSGRSKPAEVGALIRTLKALKAKSMFRILTEDGQQKARVVNTSLAETKFAEVDKALFHTGGVQFACAADRLLRALTFLGVPTAKVTGVADEKAMMLEAGERAVVIANSFRQEEN